MSSADGTTKHTNGRNGAQLRTPPPPLAGEAAYAAGTPRRGGVLCGQHQRALPSGLPLGSVTPDPEMRCISISPAGGTGDLGCSHDCLSGTDLAAKRTAARSAGCIRQMILSGIF